MQLLPCGRGDAAGTKPQPRWGAARQIAMYLIRRMTSMSLNDIGKEFGDEGPPTILHSLDKVESTMRSDPAFAEKGEGDHHQHQQQKVKKHGCGERK